MRRAILIGLALTVGMGVAPAEAQDATAYPEAAIDARIAALGECVVATPKGRRSAIDYIQMSGREMNWGAMAGKLITNACFVRSGSPDHMNMVKFKFSLISALYHADFGAAAVPDSSHFGRLDYDAEVSGGASDDYRRDRASGDCVVRSVPAVAHDLVMSEVGSARETVDFEAARVAISQCGNGDWWEKAPHYWKRGAIAQSLWNFRRGADTLSESQQQAVN